MKKLLLFFCFLSIGSFAQTDACADFASDFTSKAKAKSFDEAYALFSSNGLKCLYKGEPVYQAAEQTLLFRIANPSKQKREDLAAELIEFYIAYDKAVPSNNYSNRVKAAKLMLEHFPKKTSERFELLDAAFKTDLSNFSDAAALYDYFDLFYQKYDAEKTTISSDEFLERYIAVTSRLIALSELPENKNAATALRGIKALAGKKITCEMLTGYYSKQFEANKQNVAWLKNASAMLIDKNCTTAAEFRSVANQWHSLQPSAESAYAAAVAAQRSKDRVQAMLLYNAAATMEADPRKKADLYYILASNSGSKREDAVNYAKKALEADPTFGKAYFLMAQMYSGAGEDCAKTPFEKKALNILAAQTAAKAASASPKLKAAAAAQSESFMKRAPSSEEIKAEKKAGQTITFACWINQSVKIPN